MKRFIAVVPSSIAAWRQARNIRQSLRKSVSLISLSGALAACGGGGGAGGEPEILRVTEGRLYPAAANQVMVEYSSSGAELQRSTTSAANGSFQFPRPLSGARVESLYAPSIDHVMPVYSSRLVSPSAITQLSVTPLTTWYDQLVLGRVPTSQAEYKIRKSIAENCPSLADSQSSPSLYSFGAKTDTQSDWLLSAVGAYLQAARELGLGPKLDFTGWSGVLDRHSATLARLCELSSAISDPSWSTAQAGRLSREFGIEVPDAERLSSSVLAARSQVLSVVARQIKIDEYPGQTAALQTISKLIGHELSLGSDFVVAQYRLQTPSEPKGSSYAAAPSAAGVAISSSGQVVGTLEGATTVAGTAVASMRLVNSSASDKIVRLTLNGKDMPDLPNVIEQIVRMPVAYAGEPLYRKAWRYLINKRRNSQPLAASFFQFQPDLWLRSVGSSFCEAQAAVLYRIWAAMGYTARVYGLTGHVTVEVLVDRRWQVFDPFLEAYYTDRYGQIVGVAELEKDPDLILTPQAPKLPLTAVAYTQNVADIFSTAANNYVDRNYMSAEPDPLDDVVQIPAGGYLEVSGATNVAQESLEAGYSVDMSIMTLWVPPGYSGTIRMPLLLIDVKGQGDVQLFGRSQDDFGNITEARGLAGLGSFDLAATNPSLRDRLQYFYFHDSSSIGVSEIKVNSVGASGMTLTLLVNPLYFNSQQKLTVRASGNDLNGLHFVTPTSGPG